MGLFSAFIAKNKNRSMVTWFYLGLFFSIVPLIALVGIPTLPQVERTRRSRVSSYLIIILSITILLGGIALFYSWSNLYLPEYIYEQYPAPAYELKKVREEFDATYARLQSSYESLSTSGKSNLVGQQIELIDRTIRNITAIDGIDIGTKLGNISSLNELRMSCLQLQRMLDDIPRY